MPRDLVIGLDSGTSVVKAVAFTLDGRDIATAAVKNQVAFRPGAVAEQDIAGTWTSAARTLRALAERVPDLAQRTAALAVTGQGDGTWLLDRSGAPVAPAWLWLDGRSGEIVRAWRGDETGPAVYRITGTGLNPSLQSGQIAWHLRNRPDLLERAATALHCKDWLYHRMTGERATDPAEGIFTYGDFRTGRYDDAILELLGITSAKRLLPEIVDGTRHHAPLVAAAAAETGLRAGTPIVLGSVDVLCTALGAGLYDPGRDVGVTILGSTGMHMRLCPTAAVPLGDQVGYTMPFMVPGHAAAIQSNMAATLNIDWFVAMASDLVEASGAGRPDPAPLLATLERRAAEAAPGALLYHPFICATGERGPFVEPLARAQFLGLSSKTSAFELMRAVYEGLAFAARDCYDALGGAPAEIRLSGGAARSALCRRILASVLGRPIRTIERAETGAAGAAMMATVSLGHFKDLAEACEHWVRPTFGAIEEPDDALRAIYQSLYPSYRAGYRSMTGVWRGLERARHLSEAFGPSACHPGVGADGFAIPAQQEDIVA
ncbi:MAG TPA: FGGY-family carbohydrate kinase [Stellaceae bacterium]|nr:FGGY-family carbohydrate kinase [Stellaceae bacterium]